MKISEVQNLKVGDAISFYESGKLRTITVEQFEVHGKHIDISTHLPHGNVRYYVSIDMIHTTRGKARLAYGIDGLPSILVCTGVSLLVCNLVGIFAWPSVLICLGVSSVGYRIFN